MIQILESVPKKQTFLQKLNGSFGRGMDQALAMYKEHQTAEALRSQGIDPNFPPNFQQLAYEAKLNKDQRESELSYNLKKTQKEADVNREIRNQTQNKSQFEKKTREKPATSKKVQVEQEESTQRLPEISPEEIIQEGMQRAQRYRDEGINKSDNEVIAEVNQENNANITHNNNIDTKENNKREKQRGYGALGVEKISQLLPDASQSVLSLFQSKGEELATSGKSESEISKELSAEATKLKNTIANVKRSVGPKRTVNGVYRDIMGTSRQAQKQQEDMKIKLKPILDLGLHDEARGLLSELGYEPEERETLVSGLGEAAKKELALIPNFKKEKPGFGKGIDFSGGYAKPVESKLSEKETERLNESVLKVLKQDPATNLVLLRKGYEDKNGDWESFKDALNEAVIGGDIKLTEDQINSLDVLDQPPLSNLDWFLNKLGFTGR